MFEPKATAPHLNSTNRVSFDRSAATSGLPPINGHRQGGRHVRFVPKHEIAAR